MVERRTIASIVEAKEILEVHGWSKRYFMDCDNRRCILGALAAAWATREALNAIQDHLPEGFTTIPKFNDHKDTTYEDVMTLFDKTLADLGWPA